MPIKIDKSKVSKTAWGDVDKSALGRRLAAAYADGTASKTVIREAYAFVPEDAFGEDAEGDPTFAYSKAWGPHHELSGDLLVVNRGGVFAAAQALAGARAKPSLSGEALATARKHIRRHYRGMKEEVPDSLKESLGIVERGKPLEELVKGSMDYTMSQIRAAFRAQFPPDYDRDLFFYVDEIFSDHVIVSGGKELDSDEFYLVSYRREEGEYIFADKEDWEVVELTYRPQTSLEESKRQRFVDEFGGVELLESQDGEPRRIRAVGVTADVVNGNGRRYPAHVLEAAVAEARSHLNESLGQGRLIQLLGEVEHPTIKGGHPNILETVFKWEAISFDGMNVLLEGIILPTSKGRDIQTLLENGVQIPLSQRAYGNSVVIKEDGRRIEEVTALVITGYDATLAASDPMAAILESKKEEFVMELDLEILRERYPGLVAQIEKEHDEKERKKLEEQLMRKKEEDERISKMIAEREKELREELGVKETDDLHEAMRQRESRLKELEEKEQQRQVAEYVEGQVGDLEYPEWLREQMVEAIQAAAPKSIDEAKNVISAKRKEYDAIAAKLALAAKGFKDGVQFLGPVLEKETGTPAFARASFELTESLRKAELRPRRDFREPKTVNEEFTALYLAKFDKLYRQQLQEEKRIFEEAEQTSDLNLPYSVSRAIIAEVFPNLVAAGIFDVGLIDTSPTRIYYEAFSGETGYTVSVTDEDVTSDEGAWVELAYKRITPGTVVVEPDGGGTAFVEGTDYVIDYADGKLYTLASGSIGDATALDVDYDYTAIRKGEMAPIERGKVTLAYKTIEAAADRLADQISREAVVFSRTQLGWDAVTRTMTSLINQVRRKIDQGLIYEALAAVLIVASNSGGTWSSSLDPLAEFVEKIGVAKVKVMNRYYMPTFLLLSATIADKLANWDGFSAAGMRPDADLRAEGFAGRLKGLAVFQSTEMSDSYALVGNRELVMHRILQALQIRGPYPTYDVSGGTSKLVAADQYYVEEFNATEAPVPEKGAYVAIS